MQSHLPPIGQQYQIVEMDYSLVPGQDSYHAWTPIGQTSNQLILYHPPSHALQVRPHSDPLALESTPSPIAGPSRSPLRLLGSPPIESITTVPHCPYCSQPIPPAGPPPGQTPYSESDDRIRGRFDASSNQVLDSRRYFQILEQAHEGSRPPSPGPSTPRARYAATPTPEPTNEQLNQDENDDILDEAQLPAKGYYEQYFREDKKLGMGAEGSVFLATHVIDGNVLGSYAVKKIAVGRSKSYLFRMLREVRLMVSLRHPNIIPYHHSWVDSTRFSSFSPPITALHVLMMYATAGNLDTYLLTRSHTNEPHVDLSADDIGDNESIGQLPKAERIKAFKKRRQSAVEHGSGPRQKKAENRGVLLLGVEEIAKLFGDVVEGLAFLHANSILHLDLKCSNVLLHWEEGKLIPKALISDFGTSEEMLRGKRERTGHTGTMEYMAPETVIQDAMGAWRPSDSHADMWSLGMILHKMLFLHLPYPDTEDYDALLKEILAYPGFIPTPEVFASLERRHIPRDLVILLSKLIHLDPEKRPTAERVRAGLRGLEDRARSTGFARAGELVRRFVSPFTAVDGDGSEGRGRANPWSKSHNSTSATIEPHIHSPVRPILALPSPVDELRAPFPATSPADQNITTTLPPTIVAESGLGGRHGFVGVVPPALDFRTMRGVRFRRRNGEKLVRGTVFFIKVLSIQPQFQAHYQAIDSNVNADAKNANERPLSRYMIILLVLAILELVGEVNLGWMVGLAGIHIGVLGRAHILPGYAV